MPPSTSPPPAPSSAPLPAQQVGTTYGPVTATVDGERARCYAAATNDPNPAYESGDLAPPVFGVVPTWEAMSHATAAAVLPEALPFVVHGEQDMHFHQPLVPGCVITTTSAVHSVRAGRSGTRLTIEVDTVDDAGAAVLTQYVTLFVRGMTGGPSSGPDKPAHELPEAARRSPLGHLVLHVDEDQTFRYRDASGDHMPIHVDADFARSVGLPGIVVHGLCTMAMCGQAVLAVTAADPARLRRLAVRFAASVLPGDDLAVDVYDAGTTAGDRRAVAFEARSAGAVVVKNGWAEVAD